MVLSAYDDFGRKWEARKMKKVRSLLNLKAFA